MIFVRGMRACGVRLLEFRKGDEKRILNRKEYGFSKKVVGVFGVKKLN